MVTIRRHTHPIPGQRMHTGNGDSFNPHTLTWGDHFTFSTPDGDENYTVLVAYTAADDPSVDVVCLKGHHDLETMDLAAGEEMYLNLAATSDGNWGVRELKGEERKDVEKDFHFFFLLTGAQRVTTAEQPFRRSDEEWVIPVGGKNMICQQIMRATYGEMGEYLAHIFMGGEEQTDATAATEVFLIFLELAEEEEPPRYIAIEDQEVQDTLHQALMAAMGYEFPEEDEDPEDDC